MRILLTGGSGLLGGACTDLLVARGMHVSAPPSKELDIRDRESINRWMDRGYDWCVNCAALALFNLVERSPSLALETNALGPKYLAQASRDRGTRLMHISTDFVFDGVSDVPYCEDSETNPLSVYGRTKLLGESYVLEIAPDSLVVRTSWLFGLHGLCFPRSILEQWYSGSNLRVVADQFGTPTATSELARVLADLVDLNPEGGVLHAAGSEVMSWWDFANRVVRIRADQLGISPPAIEPIHTDAWPAAALRPRFSALSSNQLTRLGIVPMRPLNQTLEQFCTDFGGGLSGPRTCWP